jgi:hypothetical protein
MDWFTPEELMPPNNKDVLCQFVFADETKYAVCNWNGLKWVYDNSKFCPTPDKWAFIIEPEL